MTQDTEKLAALQRIHDAAQAWAEWYEQRLQNPDEYVVNVEHNLWCALQGCKTPEPEYQEVVESDVTPFHTRIRLNLTQHLQQFQRETLARLQARWKHMSEHNLLCNQVELQLQKKHVAELEESLLKEINSRVQRGTLRRKQ